jgi:hypothetical protein
MSNNVSSHTDEFGNEFVIIDRGNGEFTSLLKSTYDKMLNAPTAFPHQPLVEG